MKRSGPTLTPGGLHKHCPNRTTCPHPSSDCCLWPEELLSRVRTAPLVPHRSSLLIHLSQSFFRSINTQLHISFGLSRLWFLQWLLKMLICWIRICIDCQLVDRMYWWLCSGRETGCNLWRGVCLYIRSPFFSSDVTESQILTDSVTPNIYKVMMETINYIIHVVNDHISKVLIVINLSPVTLLNMFHIPLILKKKNFF